MPKDETSEPTIDDNFQSTSSDIGTTEGFFNDDIDYSDYSIDKDDETTEESTKVYTTIGTTSVDDAKFPTTEKTFKLESTDKG